MIGFIVLLMIISSIICERLVLLDLSPEEAQKYISSKNLDLKYARLLAERSLTQGKYDGIYYQGKLIEAPENFIEQVYEANQFHGQDGLGRAMFGYSDWNQGRLEARNANGEVRGSYQYTDPFGDNILVNYWSDSLGFHQMDNRQRQFLEPVTETPEVQAARMAHERAWQVAAKASREHPDAMSDIYNRNANKFDEEQARRDHSQEIISGVANQGQSLTRYPSLPYDNHIKPEETAASEDSVVIEANVAERSSKNSNINSGKYDEDGQNESEPRGFFYNFDYPINLIIEDDGKILKASDRGGKSLGGSSKDVLLKNNESEENYDEVKFASPRIANIDHTTIIEKSMKSVKEIEKIDNGQELKKIEVASKECETENKKIEIRPETKAIEITPPKNKQIESKPETKAIEITAVEVKNISENEEVIIPVEVKIESDNNTYKKSEQIIDAVHDAQIHPKQLLVS